jgi:carbonic anhydrase
MNKLIQSAAGCGAFFIAAVAQANDHPAPLLDPQTQIRGVIASMLQGNARYSKARPAKYFQTFADKQSPRATVVTCADSRVHENDFHASPDNDLFMVRNIGNQIATAEGSVEYGVRHLNTPLLMIVGHAVCGAIKAATGDYAAIEPAIKSELNTIRTPKGMDVTDGVLLNVNQQVDTAMRKFSPEISSGKLAVIGAYYDFRNDLKMGYGKLVITNINGTTDPDSIQSLLRSGKLLRRGGH